MYFWGDYPVKLRKSVFASQQNATLDLIPPIIIGPPDISYLVNTTGHNITWEIADKNPRNYSIQHNYLYIETEKNKSWTQNQSVSISIDHLPIGIHLYIIIVEDLWNNKIADDVKVNVKETAYVPTFNYSTTSLINLGDFLNPFFLLGIGLLSLLAIVGRIKIRRKEDLDIDLPPEDPLELESSEN